MASIEDEGLRTATELQIAHFGQCPMQLFFFPHIHKLPSTSPRFKFSLKHVWESNEKYFEEAKLSDWVHLSSLPPVSKNLMAVRICGTDKVVAIDENGIIHFFKWLWKPDEVTEDEDEEKVSDPDQGCFVAQREVINFKTVPRLAYTFPDASNDVELPIAVAVSRTMFASQTLLLVLSDGNGKGALALQFLDPSKNIIKGVAIIPSVHSSRITCIAMDTMGSVSYQSYFSGGGGVGMFIYFIFSFQYEILIKYCSFYCLHLQAENWQFLVLKMGVQLYGALSLPIIYLCDHVYGYEAIMDPP